MPTQTKERRRERAAEKALARSAFYRLLSQALAYPSGETVQALKELDLPQAKEAAPALPPQLTPLLEQLDERLGENDVAQLQAQHRRVFSHILSLDCPPCETFYTARHVFQETQELSDISGFFRAFGLKIADTERLDHISAELEFMHFLAYKEAHALIHHGPAKARLCRDGQEKFVRDHLGRWAIRFADRLRAKDPDGYFAAVASLTEAFVSADTEHLGIQPEAAAVDPQSRTTSPEDFVCPAAEGCQ